MASPQITLAMLMSMLKTALCMFVGVTMLAGVSEAQLHRLPRVAAPENIPAALTPTAWDDLPAVTQSPPSNTGGFRIAPYGWLRSNMVYATERTQPGPYTFYALSSESQGESAYHLDARGSRIGIDIQGPAIPAFSGASNGGRIEVDFLGQFVTENTAGLRLRHAYWEIGDDTYKLLVGQTWDVISPLNPGVLNFSVGWFGGNIGFRRAQFRAERYYCLSDNVKIDLQGSLNQDIVPDFPDEPGVRRESVGWPVIQGRCAINWLRYGDGKLDATLGISGHLGETGFDFLAPGPPPQNLPPADDTRFQTWSFNVDLHLPITPRFGIQGEFFTGANLSSFFGGIGQGVCPCLRVPIRSTGGWAEIWYDWNPRLHSHIGYGLDDPRNNDLVVGRIYNQFLFANVLFDITDKFDTGLEVSYWKTLYQEPRRGLIPDAQLQPAAPGKSVTIDWMVRYTF
jgi:hypothetical protein